MGTSSSVCSALNVWQPDSQLTSSFSFGAVLEEFEVRDALSSVFATKHDNYAAFRAMA